MEEIDEKIIEAVNNKNYTQLEQLLEDKNLLNYKGIALKSAIFNNDEEMIKFLVEKGADIHISEEYMLRRACEKGLFDTVKLLVEKQADISALGYSSFMSAVKNNHFDIADFLLEKEKNIINLKGVYLKTIGKNANALEYLYSRNFILDDLTKSLLECVNANNKKGIEFFLEKGADINYLNPNPLELAIKLRNEDMCFFLIKKGANIHVNNESIINLACRAGFIDIVKFCVKENSLEKSEHNLIKTAVLAEDLEMLKYLVNIKQNVSLANEAALRRAAERGLIDIMQFLLENGSDINFDDGFVLKKAVETKNYEMIEFCIMNDAKLTQAVIDSAREPNLLEHIQKLYSAKQLLNDLTHDLQIKSQQEVKLKI